jgi:hypothetical protein
MEFLSSDGVGILLSLFITGFLILVLWFNSNQMLLGIIPLLVAVAFYAFMLFTAIFYIIVTITAHIVIRWIVFGVGVVLFFVVRIISICHAWGVGG